MTPQQVVWITGGASGIGRATALALSADGARVVVSDRDEAALESLAAEAAVAIEPLDISLSDGVTLVASRILETYGRIDALVNCAGINLPERHLDQLTIEGWDRVIGINLSGIYYCCHAVLPHMRANGAGTIVTVASWAARTSHGSPVPPTTRASAPCSRWWRRSTSKPSARGSGRRCSCPKRSTRRSSGSGPVGRCRRRRRGRKCCDPRMWRARSCGSLAAAAHVRERASDQPDLQLSLRRHAARDLTVKGAS